VPTLAQVKKAVKIVSMPFTTAEDMMNARRLIGEWDSISPYDSLDEEKDAVYYKEILAVVIDA
jgi:hypothetical protein